MGKNKFILRSFYYLNERIIEDYTSSIYGVIPTKHTSTDSSHQKTTGHLKIADKERSKEEKKQKTLMGTASGLFSKLYTELARAEMFQDFRTSGFSYDSLQRGELLELEGIIHPCGINQLFQRIGEMMVNQTLNPFLQKKSGRPTKKEKRKKAFIKLLSQEQKSHMVKLEVNTLKKIPIYLKVNTDYLWKETKLDDLYQTEFTIFLKVIRILKEGEKKDIFKLGELRIGSLPQMEKVMDPVITQFRNQPEIASALGISLGKDDFYIAYPAIIGETIGIYN